MMISLEPFELESRQHTARALSYARRNPEGLQTCKEFEGKCSNIEKSIELCFSSACVFAKQAKSIERIAEIWHEMTLICNGLLGALDKLSSLHPKCCGRSIHSKVTRIKELSEERYELHA